jgi:ABC-2 type transport system permease protein
MSGFSGIRLVALREITEAFRRKSYWVIVAVLVLGSSAAMIVPAMIDDDGRPTDTIAVVGRSARLDDQLIAAVDASDADARLLDAPDAATARRLVDDDDADLGIVVGDPSNIIVKGDDHQRLVAAAQQALAAVAVADRLHAAGLTDADVEQVLTTPAAAIERLDTGRGGRIAAAFAISLVLYLLLLTLMMQVANGTAIEKSNRISEVLLAIVRPGALLFGKVLGVTATGLMAILGGLLPVIVKLAVGGDLPANLGGAVAAGAVWFLLGLALYLTLAGALGALVERQEEAGSAVSPLMAIIIGTFIVLQPGPGSALNDVLAYIPFSSPLVVPARIAAGESSAVEIVGSLVLLVATVALAYRFGAVVYQRAIVRTGRRLKLGEVLRAAR